MTVIFFPSILRLSFHCLMACIVFIWEVCCNSYFCSSACKVSFFSIGYLQDIVFICGFQQLYLRVCVHVSVCVCVLVLICLGVLWSFCVCSLVSFISSGKFLATISTNTASNTFSFAPLSSIPIAQILDLLIPSHSSWMFFFLHSFFPFCAPV